MDQTMTWDAVPALSLVRDPAGRAWLVADKWPAAEAPDPAAYVLLINSEHRHVERRVEPWDKVTVITTELAAAFALILSFPETRLIGAA
jgi:hypothetical protein